MENASAVMREDNEDEQNFKPNGVYGETIYRRELTHVIVEECSPCL